MRLPIGTLRQNHPGWVRNGTRASVPGGVQAPGIAIAQECFDQFLPAGGSCGRVQDALHPLPPPECAGPAPQLLYLGSLRKQRELWFLQNCAVAFASRLLEAQTPRG